jgi:MFS family permease
VTTTPTNAATQTAATIGTADAPAKPSALSPLKYRLFRFIWLAGLASNIGTFMHTVGAAWLMTTLTNSPGQVALLQTATAVPAFALALLAGALADVVDRRRLLIWSQMLMLVAAALLGVLTMQGRATPGVLLWLTVVLGVGATLNLPAWAASIPELIPRSELAPAVALNAVGINAAAALGPALGGIVVATLGPEWVFIINAASFLAVIAAVAGWKRQPSAGLPAEHIGAAVRTGVRYVRNAPSVQVVLIKGGLFMLCASALTALMPVVARARLDASAGEFGILSAGVGAGAVLAAFGLPRLRRTVSVDVLVMGAALGYAAATAVVAYSTSLALTCAALLLSGGASITFMSTSMMTMQAVLPSWVRGRALALFLLVFQGSMAAGAAIWGTVATRTSPATALLCAAIGLVVGTVLASPLRLAGRADVDPSQARLWPDPVIMIEHGEDDGPVLVQLEWVVEPGDVAAFTATMHEVAQQRRRDGALRWGLYQDTAVPGRLVESYTVATWAEHERQHQRVTTADLPALSAANAFLRGSGEPTTTHLLAGRAQRHQNGAATATAAHQASCTVGCTG